MKDIGYTDSERAEKPEYKRMKRGVFDRKLKF